MFEHLWRRPCRTVLIVTENPAAPGFDGAFLQEPDVRLLTSYPDDDALDMARRERPSLIIEDLDAAGGQGIRFCKELRNHRATRSIPLIVVTSPANRREAGEARADALLEKPLGRRELYQAVQRFIPLPRRRWRRLVTNLRFTFEIEGQTFQAFSRDVSERGVFLKTDRLPPLGSRLTLCFRLPGSWSEIRCTGQVRNTTAGDDRIGGIGIEFEGLGDTDRDRLDGFIRRQISRGSP